MSLGGDIESGTSGFEEGCEFLSLARFQVHQLLSAVLNSCEAWRHQWNMTTEQIFDRQSDGRGEGGAVFRG